MWQIWKHAASQKLKLSSRVANFDGESEGDQSQTVNVHMEEGRTGRDKLQRNKFKLGKGFNFYFYLFIYFFSGSLYYNLYPLVFELSFGLRGNGSF